ncbi:MAG: DUF2249 domain-containing protein [Bacilli bacterium]|nr:DUF2249 domain-containing protein [Bacilli bacterium]
MNITVKLDVRTIPVSDKHPTIIKTFLALNPGETLELINDHDPKPMYYYLSAEYPNTFTWEYLQQGPITYRVAITKK